MSETVAKTGKFEKLESKSAPPGKGNWTVFNCFISGVKYGLGFDTSLVKDLNTGDFVEFTVSQDAKGYWKLDSVKKVEPPKVVTFTDSVCPSTPLHINSAPVLPSVPTGQWGRSPLEITRQECLKVASDLFTNYLQVTAKKMPSLDQCFAKVVAFADHLVFYVQTGQLEPQTEEETKLKEAVVNAVNKEPEDDDLPF